MTNWTLILAAVGTASATGASTLTATWLQGRATRESTRQQTEAMLRRIQAENERLRTQHGEDHRRHCRGVYHQFLDVASRFDLTLRQLAPLIESGEITQEPF
jgi:hypothetical protein